MASGSTSTRLAIESWVFIFIRQGIRREVGLGSYGNVSGKISLADARRRADEAREIVKNGGDPRRDMAHRRRMVKLRTFGECADDLLASKENTFRNAKHAAQWPAQEPQYPAVARTAENQQAFSDAFNRLGAFCSYRRSLALKRAGCHPDDHVSLDLAAGISAQSEAGFIWLSNRCKALEARVKELEERPVTQYRGVWANEETYRRGDMITYSGSTWHCELDSSRGVRPGDGIGWRLMVKKGRDGKDASR